jgi:hypothetical protein
MPIRPDDRMAFARSLLNIADSILGDTIDAETAAKRLRQGADWLISRDFSLDGNTESSPPPENVPAADIQAVFDHWVRVTNRPRARLTAKRRKKIESRLREFSVTQLRAAIDVAASDPFWGGGGNRTGDRIDTIERTLASTERVEEFVERAGDRLRQITRDDGSILDSDEMDRVDLLKDRAREALREGRNEDYNEINAEIRRIKDAYDA